MCSWRSKSETIHSCASFISISANQLFKWEDHMNFLLCCWNHWLLLLTIYLKNYFNSAIKQPECVCLCFRVLFRIPHGAWCRHWSSRWESWGSTLMMAAMMEFKEICATVGQVLVFPQTSSQICYVFKKDSKCALFNLLISNNGILFLHKTYSIYNKTYIFSLKYVCKEFAFVVTSCSSCL